MIQLGTLLTIADNTGAKLGMCFKVYRGSRHRYAGIGDEIMVAVKEATPTASVKKKARARAVVVRCVQRIKREDGTYVRADQNACVLVDEKGDPKGTRVFGPVFRELRKDYQKIISLAEEVV